VSYLHCAAEFPFVGRQVRNKIPAGRLSGTPGIKEHGLRDFGFATYGEKPCFPQAACC
jgi:hypothetical protein